MELNITNTNLFQFENQENLQTTVKTILEKSGAKKEVAEELIESNFSNAFTGYTNAQVEGLKALLNINIAKPLKQTKKYLKNHKINKIKNGVLGELWEVFETTESSAVENSAESELFELEIDENIKNIFNVA